MKNKVQITVLIILIGLISTLASLTGILSDKSSDLSEIVSVRGESVSLYAKGLYAHMSSDVAVQGIAQDYVTLFLAIPLLILSLIASVRGSKRARFILAGITAYFFVTYLFYFSMAMYNVMFLAYICLMGLSFFALFLVLKDITGSIDNASFAVKSKYKFSGGFLMFNSVAIGLLWLGIVVSPLMDGSIFPLELQHYTTLIVQGFDLGLLLPLSFVTGLLLFKRRLSGLIYGTVYLVFLSLLMIALTAKIIAMAMQGQNVIPVIIIIPGFAFLAMVNSILMLRSLKSEKVQDR